MAALVVLIVAGCGDGGRTRPVGDDSIGQTAGGGAGQPVVVDTDLASDDLVALLFLLSSSEVDIRAVTVSGTGEVRCPQGLKVARGLLAVTGHDEVPIACGRSTPLAGDHTFPVEWRDAADSAWGVELPDVEVPADPPTAADLLAKSLSTDRVTLLTLGPLTNPAEAFRADPDLADRVGRVVIMGGAVDVGGNVYSQGAESPSAEWNLYIDPVAADEVLASGASITLVGLDATSQALISPEFVEQLQSDAQTEAGQIVSQLLASNPLVGRGEAYFWDPLAAAFIVEPELVATEETKIRVVTQEGADSGRTVRDSDGHRVKVAVGADAEELENLLADTLNRE